MARRDVERILRRWTPPADHPQDAITAGQVAALLDTYHPEWGMSAAEMIRARRGDEVEAWALAMVGETPPSEPPRGPFENRKPSAWPDPDQGGGEQ